jgi:hypothetical protein
LDFQSTRKNRLPAKHQVDEAFHEAARGAEREPLQFFRPARQRNGSSMTGKDMGETLRRNPAQRKIEFGFRETFAAPDPRQLELRLRWIQRHGQKIPQGGIDCINAGGFQQTMPRR